MKCVQLKEITITRDKEGRMLKVEEKFKECIGKKCNSWNPYMGKERVPCFSYKRIDSLTVNIDK